MIAHRQYEKIRSWVETFLAERGIAFALESDGGAALTDDAHDGCHAVSCPPIPIGDDCHVALRWCIQNATHMDLEGFYPQNRSSAANLALVFTDQQGRGVGDIAVYASYLWPATVERPGPGNYRGWFACFLTGVLPPHPKAIDLAASLGLKPGANLPISDFQALVEIAPFFGWYRETAAAG